jgi:hypothetical protein
MPVFSLTTLTFLVFDLMKDYLHLDGFLGLRFPGIPALTAYTDREMIAKLLARALQSKKS